MSHGYQRNGNRKKLEIKICRECDFIFNSRPVEPDFEEDYEFLSSSSKQIIQDAKIQAKRIRKIFSFLTKRKPKRVLEIASNDGYLLKQFTIQDANIEVFGVDPSKNASNAAKKAGVKQYQGYLCLSSIEEIKDFVGAPPDIIVANNVLTHVQDIKEFIKCIKWLSGSQTLVFIRYQSTLDLINKKLFDCFYHENYSFPFLKNIQNIAQNNQMNALHARHFKYHGGTIEICIKMDSQNNTLASNSMKRLLKSESRPNFDIQAKALVFAEDVVQKKERLKKFLQQLKAENKKILGYSAPQKAVTMLNMCSITEKEIEFIGDISIIKQGNYVPGTKIKIISPRELANQDPDIVMVFAWNLIDEIREYLTNIGIAKERVLSASEFL